MTVTLVQSPTAFEGGVGGGTSATFASPPTPGNLLLAALTVRGSQSVSTPAGWNLVDDPKTTPLGFGDNGQSFLYWKIAGIGESSTVTITNPGSDRRWVIAELATDVGTWAGVLADSALADDQAAANDYPVGPVDAVHTAVLVGLALVSGEPVTYTDGAGFTTIDQGKSHGFGPTSVLSFRAVAPGTYSWQPSSGRFDSWAGVLAVLELVPAFVADFTANRRSGAVPLTVDFTDASEGGTGTPNSWAWDFGDGTSSTAQDPTHVYAVAGAYTVTLTVGTDDGESDTEVKVAFITVGDVYVAPPPSNAVVEIRAAAPGSSRWGSALWGVGTWSPAGWQDVTPESVDATVRWGSHNPERGILTETEAATWIVNTFDPERLLDPGNPDSPYAADLVAGLPIRIRHRGTIVRQGVAESIAFFHLGTRGGIRVTDALSLLARTPVPDDSDLADTLRARARDAIAAAGLRITVEPDPPGGDPELAPRLEGDRSAWRHIADAAQQTLHVAYVDRIGTVRFRPWAAPYDRGRGVDATQLVDLGTVAQTRGLYSVVQARELVDEGGDLVERRLTPVPRWGAVTYTRDDATPDAGAWADAVLADRSLQTVQWIPGQIFPLDADAVEYFATLEAIERFGVENGYTDPAVDVTGIIVGGEIRVRSQRAAEAVWGFTLELAQTATSPLYTDTDPAEFLRSEAGDAYLYPG